MKKLTHADEQGGAKMVDMTGKPATDREAVAGGSVYMKKATLDLIARSGIAKGNVFETAKIAGIMAAKRVPSLIPLCHQLNLSSVAIDFEIDRRGKRVVIEAKVSCFGQTGVEMEALTAVSVAALTVYDMCKAVDKEMTISDIMLLEKRGGKSGDWKR
jgi:cyclic pyranopterin phosphate synthase